MEIFSVEISLCRSQFKVDLRLHIIIFFLFLFGFSFQARTSDCQKVIEVIFEGSASP